MPTEALHWLGGLEGYRLIGAICLLVALEEIGVPMPFAPGDVMLLVAGATVVMAHLNPVVVILATYLAALGGALIGREVFDRLGSGLLQRVADLGNLGSPVERLGARLRLGGARAVFVGRVTPGFRVWTTEVSGLVRLPRQTFLRGLVPAVAVYEAVFLGLGIELGPTALGTVHRYEGLVPGIVLLASTITIAVLVCRHLWRNMNRHVIGSYLRAVTLPWTTGGF